MKKEDLYNIIGMIDDDLIDETNNSTKRKKRFKYTKIAAIVAAVTLTLGITAWSANYFTATRVASSSTILGYTSLPSNEKILKDTNIDMNPLENFKNGYVFKSGNIVNSHDIDENGKEVELPKGLSLEYVQGKDKISLSIDMLEWSDLSAYVDLSERYKDVELYYSSYINKCVPGNYQQTEQDIIDEAEGKLVFSYGTPKIEIVEVQSMMWIENNINYTFTSIDNDISKTDLIDMAKEVIDAQN